MSILRDIRMPELLIILVIALLLLGAKKIPELAHSLGNSMREFKRGVGSIDDHPRDSKLETRVASPETGNPAPSRLSP